MMVNIAGGLFYLACIAGLIMGLILMTGKPKKIARHLAENKSVSVGWYLVAAAALIFLFVSEAKAVEVDFFIGVDEVRLQSPQCKNLWPEYSDNLTSNIGLNAWIVRGQYVSAALQQSHGSCVYNQDRNVYDATGGVLVAHLGRFVDISLGKEYFYDIGDWASIYQVKLLLIQSNDGRGTISLKYTQRDINDRALESELNYKGAGLEARLRTDFNFWR